MDKAKEILNKLSLIEKAKLTVGKDFWHTHALLNRSLLLTDGPHGLRKQTGQADHLGLNISIPATCYPTASCLACSFNDELLYEVGKAIGVECVQNGVDVLLGPAINIKRNPLGGRNFEYYSEDPLLAGKLAASFIRGVQSNGIASCIKHFACNNQEFARMINDSIVDDVALNELYLKPFEIAIKEANPYAIMSAYNKINGIYASENVYLLKHILRDKWQYDGLVISDWGAINDKIASIKNGMVLEMPASLSYYDVLRAIKEGKLSVSELDDLCLKIIELFLKINPLVMPKPNCHNIAKKAALESIVLLKNEKNILPLALDDEILIAGNPNLRIQGAGSSKVNPTQVDSFLESLNKAKANYKVMAEFNKETVINAQKIVCLLELKAEYETEGADRTNLNLDEDNLALINNILKYNKNVIVVLTTGSVVELPFLEEIQGLILTYLAGQAVGSALVEILYGKVNPSGHLAESWLTELTDCSTIHFSDDARKTIYNESVYVGYRNLNQNVSFPFGFGLSYTNFNIANCLIKDNTLEVEIVNSGDRFGKEVIQVYVKSPYKKYKELKVYQKVGLNPKEKKVLPFPLEDDYFMHYSLEQEHFVCCGGKYDIYIGASSDCQMCLEYQKEAGIYNLSYPKEILPDEEYLKTNNLSIGKEIIKPYTLNSSMQDIKNNILGKMLNYFGLKAIKKRSKTTEEYEMSKQTFLNGPIRLIGMGLPKSNNQLQGIVDMLNGKLIRGLIRFLKREKKLNKK